MEIFFDHVVRGGVFKLWLGLVKLLYSNLILISRSLPLKLCQYVWEENDGEEKGGVFLGKLGRNKKSPLWRDIFFLLSSSHFLPDYGPPS